MKFTFIKEIIGLAEKFDSQNQDHFYANDINGFKSWIADKELDKRNSESTEQIWQGKEEGRSPESVISTLLVHLNRYAKTYSKSAIAGSDFKTQDEFSYLINLKAFGSMTKMELIKKNIHDKSSGILIINRLINQGWIQQSNSQEDKRSKVLNITEAGKLALDNQMEKIRNATQIVSGNLNHSEKMELIRILDKLEKFHQPIFSKNINSEKLLETVYQDYSFGKN
ncbi:MarR family winged helix-turn-helix transcriptional regulator [Chryseobacterium sp. FH1]|uniref:MarR family winged helix-turn-helix transcriptional regulator n=1 Tax=Chryseobacterium sp. FH1 TaxID=1233951 RepID=UPI0004E2ABAB|nr:MarR family winged helix-turn-helix transcriptional regulator [Chryseobacterium sp. FH1]KFC20560.1 MarR family transcriptional regulator [Chryseobacterium sp. FH1]